MRKTIAPARRIGGVVQLPGDKSISHRYAMLAAIAEGESRIRNYSSGGDCQSTLGCIEAMGIDVTKSDEEVVIKGRGLDGLSAPADTLDAGNSGSTIRMLSGILAAQPFDSVMAGDESLARRPMDRIIRPLTEMGARIESVDGRPPLRIHGSKLHPIDYTLPVASAQVKSAVLFAGLFADGVTTVSEPVRTRDHSEIALREFGAELTCVNKVIRLDGRPKLTGRELYVPGDLSSAAFFLVAAMLLQGSELTVAGVGLNPTRSSLIDFLVGVGADLKVTGIEQVNGELVGSLRITGRQARGGVIEGPLAAALIDEIPVLAVLGAASEQGLEVRDAAELRHKETNRIDTVSANLHRMGVEVEARPDGLRIPGGQRFHAASLDSFGDHRIAMAFAVASLAADGECTIDNAEAASVSYPAFYQTLDSVVG